MAEAELLPQPEIGRHRARPAWGWVEPWTLAALALAVVASLPPILAQYPQMTDYPAHLARWYVMLNHKTNAVLDAYYGFRWAWSGNLGADLLVRPLNALFGLETAGRIMLIAIPMLTGWAIVQVERALRGRVGVGSLLAMATIWSPALIMGFLNFTLSIALTLFAFAFWVRQEGWKWREAWFVPIGLVVWLCHQSGWGVLGVMLFAYEFHQRKGRGLPLWQRVWQAGLSTWPLWLGFVPTVLAGQQAPGSFDYGPRPLWVKWIHWKTALRDRHGYLDIATVILFVALPFIALAFRRLDRRLAIAALLLVLLALIVPRHLGGGDYADYRLIAVALMLGALAIDWKPEGRRGLLLVPIASAPFLIRIALTTMAWQEHSGQVRAMLKALDYMPRGAKVAYAFEEVAGLWPTPAMGHIGSWATVRRDALTNCHFAIPGVHMLTVKAPGWNYADPSQRYLLRRTKRVDLTTFKPARGADFLWYYGERPPIAMPANARIIFRTRHSFLARLEPQAPVPAQ